MIFHVSISAVEPEHVAGVFAELWNGKYFPFAPVARGSFIAIAGDDRNSAVEIYPRGTELVPAEGDADATSIHNAASNGRGPTHFAMRTTLSEEQVMDIARREGWEAKYRKRGGIFGVIELWIENVQMVEVLTEPMCREYLEGMTQASWENMMSRGHAPAN